jgi:signal transduction histidine kinase
MARPSCGWSGPSLYREAREALAARDEFLSVAAHEIRGPVTSLHLAVQGMLDGVPPPVAEKMMRVIEREDRRLARFVEELLDVARIRGRQLHFVFGPVDLVEVVHEAVSRVAPELTRSGSSLSVSAPGQVVGTWDRTRLEQVVANLLSNAIKFGLGKPIELRLEQHAKLARLVMRDHGIGISPDAQARIFSPFERAVSGRHYGGLGLGLYIVKTIVDGMAGTVRLDSQPGSGSTFTVELPIARPS